MKFPYTSEWTILIIFFSNFFLDKCNLGFPVLKDHQKFQKVGIWCDDKGLWDNGQLCHSFPHEFIMIGINQKLGFNGSYYVVLLSFINGDVGVSAGTDFF